MTTMNNYDGPFDPSFDLNKLSRPALARLGGGMVIMLSDADAPGFDAAVTAVNPKSRCRPSVPSDLALGGGKPVCAWEIVIEDEGEPRVNKDTVKPFLADSRKNFHFTSCNDK